MANEKVNEYLEKRKKKLEEEGKSTKVKSLPTTDGPAKGGSFGDADKVNAYLKKRQERIENSSYEKKLLERDRIVGKKVAERDTKYIRGAEEEKRLANRPNLADFRAAANRGKWSGGWLLDLLTPSVEPQASKALADYIKRTTEQQSYREALNALPGMQKRAAAPLEELTEMQSYRDAMNALVQKDDAQRAAKEQAEAFNWGNYLKGAAQAGWAGMGSGYMKTVNAGLKPLQEAGVDALQWLHNNTFLPDITDQTANVLKGKNPLGGLYDWAVDPAERAAAYAQQEAAKGGYWAEVGNQVIQSTIQQVPNVALTAITGGTNLTADLGSQAAGGFGAAVLERAKALVSSPAFANSYAQMYGQRFEDAQADGANAYAATLTATITTLMNAAVEAGSGVEDLPFKKSGVRDWVVSALEEGREEVIQQVIDRLGQKAYINKKIPWFSMEDKEAVINPQTLLENQLIGTIAGGLSGAPAAVLNAAGGQQQTPEHFPEWVAPKISDTGAQILRDQNMLGLEEAKDRHNERTWGNYPKFTPEEKAAMNEENERMRQLAERAVERQMQGTTPQSAAQTALLGEVEPDASSGGRSVSPTIAQMAQEYGEDAGVFTSHYEGGDAAQYKRGFDAMFNAGKSGLSLEMLGGVSDQLTRGMSEVTKQSIYTAGRNRAANTITPGVQRLTTKKLDSNQRMFVRVWDAIGKEYGLEIDVVDSIKNSNAVYRKGGRRIVVALDAAEGAYVQAAAHEAVHYIRSMDANGYEVLKDVVLKHLTGEDAMFDLDTAISERMAQYAKHNRSLTEDDAIEEIVAEAVPTFFGDKEAVRAFAKENRTLAEKIRDFFVEFANKVREIAERYMVSQDRAEIAEILDKTEALKEIAQTFDLALRSAQEKQGAAKSDGEVMTARKRNEIAGSAWSREEARLNEAGLATSDDGEVVYPADRDVLYSLKTLPETDYIKERDKAAAALSKRLGVTAEEAQRYIDNLTSISAIVAADQMRLDFEAEEAYGAVKPNSDYKWTVDFSTLCKKRLLYTGTFDAIQKQLADVILTENDYIRLREMMAEKEYEVACAFCYVESRRKNNGRIIAEFLKVYREAQQGDGIMELGPKNRRRKFRTERGFDPEIASFNTSDGFTDILHNHRGVYDAYMYFMNARGASKPKLIESRTAYTQEILAKFKSASTVKAMNRRGGLRLQSFSDFEVVNLLDMMQVVTDMSRVGLMSQAYTKVPEFARVFGGTGIKINLSLVTKGVDENGNLIFDDVEGMPHKEAFRIREMYGENVGAILVGKDDATIRAAMKDPRIDYIIPFHASGWSLANQAALGIAGYENYTKGQLETDAKTGKKIDKQYYPADYWDETKTGDENAQIYLDMCRKSGRNPKFPKFAGESGYWKMLIDFRMYDNEGNYAPQRPVRPDINMDEARRVLDEYRGGHNKLPVARDVVEQFMAEYREKHAEDGEIRLSMKEEGPETALTEDQNMRLPADVQVDSETIRRQAATAIQVGLRAKLNQQIKGVTARILKETGSKYKRADLEESIREIVSDYARHGFNDGSMRRVSEIAKAIIGAGAEAGADIMAQDADLAAANLALRIQGDVMGMIGAKNAAQQLYGSAQRMREQFRKEYEAELRERQKARVAEFQRIAGELKAAKEKGDSAEQKRIMGQYRTALKNVDAETAISVVNAANKVRNEQREEIRERAQLREKVTKRANELMKMLMKPENGKRVPTKLQGAVLDVLGVLDVNGQRAAESGRETKRAAEFREKLEGIRKFYEEVWDSQSKGDAPEGLGGLMMALSERTLVEIRDELLSLAEGGVVNIRSMDSVQLRGVEKLLKNVKHTVDSIGKLWRIQRYEGIIQLGDASIAEMDSRGRQKITNKAAGAVRDFFALNMMEPVSYGERLGEAGAAVIQSLMDGEKIKFGKIREASEATERMLKEIGVRGYDIGRWRKKVQEVTFGGAKVRITEAQLMGLYLTAKRPKGRQHLLGGGFVLRDPKRTGAQEETIRPTEAELADIADHLSDKQRQLADRMGEYLSTAVAKWGNDVTQRMYLYDAFLEKHYWPLSSDSSYHKTEEPEMDRMFNAIINASFTKQTDPNADDELVIMDAFDIFGKHIGEMASYAGYAEALTDALGWLNYKVRNSETNLNEASVKRSMKKLLGNGGVDYMAKLLQDINGARRETEKTPVDKIGKNAKVAAVVGKISVAIQQPTSIVRAAAEINPWYLIKAMRPTKGLPKGKRFFEWLKGNGTVEEMQKWSNLAWWKSNGNYDIGIGKGTDAILWGDTSRLQTAGDIAVKVGELGFDPGKMDDLTWAHMWLAVKEEVRRKRKRDGLTVEGDEYFRAVAERFEYVMDRTQVVDTVMHRSALMRSKNDVTKQLTSFMSEPTKSYNMLMRAAMEVSRKPNDATAHKRLMRTTAAFAVSVVANAAAKGLYEAFRYRDDDEDKLLEYMVNGEFTEDWRKRFLINMVSGLNPLENIPIVSTVYEAIPGDRIAKYLGFEQISDYLPSGDVAGHMGLEGIADLAKAGVDALQYMLDDNSGKRTKYGVWGALVKAASEAFGLPFAGIMTNVETLGRIFDPKWAQSKSVMATMDEAYRLLYEATVKGDKKKALDIRTQINKGLYGATPKSPQDIDTGVGRHLALNDERVLKAWQMREKGNQNSQLVAMHKEMQRAGFTDAQTKYAVNHVQGLYESQYNDLLDEAEELMQQGRKREAQAALDEAKALKDRLAKYGMVLEKEKEKDMEAELKVDSYDYKHLFSSIRNGGLDDVEGVAGVMEMESDAEDPEKAIRSAVSSEFREEYIQAVLDSNSAKVRDLDEKLDYFDIDKDDRAQWVKEYRYDQVEEALNAGKTSKADEIIEELRESGVTDESIASSVRSRYKEKYIELVVNGDDDEAEELYEMLNGLGLVTEKKRENCFTRKKMDKWVEDWEKAQKD